MEWFQTHMVVHELDSFVLWFSIFFPSLTIAHPRILRELLKGDEWLTAAYNILYRVRIFNILCHSEVEDVCNVACEVIQGILCDFWNLKQSFSLLTCNVHSILYEMNAKMSTSLLLVSTVTFQFCQLES